MRAEASWDKCDDTVATTSSATTVPRRNSNREGCTAIFANNTKSVSEIVAGKKPYSSLNEFYVRTGISMLSWYANSLAMYAAAEDPNKVHGMPMQDVARPRR
jgi:hypothetical protein